MKLPMRPDGIATRIVVASLVVVVVTLAILAVGRHAGRAQSVHGADGRRRRVGRARGRDDVPIERHRGRSSWRPSSPPWPRSCSACSSLGASRGPIERLADAAAADRRGRPARHAPGRGPGRGPRARQRVQRDGRPARRAGRGPARVRRQRLARAANPAHEPAGLPRGAPRRRPPARSARRSTRCARRSTGSPGWPRRSTCWPAPTTSGRCPRTSTSARSCGRGLELTAPSFARRDRSASTGDRPGRRRPRPRRRARPGRLEPAPERDPLHARRRRGPRGASRATDGDAIVRVANTGSEIPAEDLPRVWERFFRVERSRDRATGGAGIGLAIVKRLIEEAGGRVGATSEAGVTTFWFSLPT